MALKESPSQTAGPYVHIGCLPQTAGLEQRHFGPQLGANLSPASGEDSITVEIEIRDGAGELVKDALIETWHAGPKGDYRAAGALPIWHRQASDLSNGVAKFHTFRPNAYDGQAPHLLVWIVARGINLGLTTRLYFPDAQNDNDPVLGLAGPRAATLIATQTDTGYAHTINLQGAMETVFFDV